MNFLQKFVRKQGALVLNKPPYAYALIVLFAVVPLMSWFSVSIAALITLRNGPEAGIRAMGMGMLTLIVASFLTTSTLTITQATILIFTYFPTYVAALILRATTSWRMVTLFLLLLSSAIVFYFYFFTPQFLVEQYQLLQQLIQGFQKDATLTKLGVDKQLTLWFDNKPRVITYLLGVQAVIFLLNALTTLMIARSIQSQLFYPQGFQKEMLAFSIHPFTLPVFLLIVLGIYTHQTIAICFLPVWGLYIVAGGLSVILSFFSNKPIFLIFILLLIAVYVLPMIMLPLIMTVGAIDSVFDLRKRLNLA